ncbi:hypothetical protein T492DRAFT_999953 [Pavlovales sp. CCMP2436]|nr:hypothetical protein T492DRAFT_999953 [Pavlovales sp. CCMP2436]
MHTKRFFFFFTGLLCGGDRPTKGLRRYLEYNIETLMKKTVKPRRPPSARCSYYARTRNYPPFPIPPRLTSTSPICTL